MLENQDLQPLFNLDMRSKCYAKPKNVLLGIFINIKVDYLKGLSDIVTNLNFNNKDSYATFIRCAYH